MYRPTGSGRHWLWARRRANVRPMLPPPGSTCAAERMAPHPYAVCSRSIRFAGIGCRSVWGCLRSRGRDAARAQDRAGRDSGQEPARPEFRPVCCEARRQPPRRSPSPPHMDGVRARGRSLNGESRPGGSSIRVFRGVSVVLALVCRPARPLPGLTAGGRTGTAASLPAAGTRQRPARLFCARPGGRAPAGQAASVPVGPQFDACLPACLPAGWPGAVRAPAGSTASCSSGAVLAAGARASTEGRACGGRLASPRGEGSAGQCDLTPAIDTGDRTKGAPCSWPEPDAGASGSS